MSSRIGFRLFQNARLARMPLRRPVGRRYQITDSTAAPSQNVFQKLWNSPVGMKTVHFWAPVMKWALVLAGVGDFWRPAEKLSLTQNLALMCTGAIWTRWCLIIKPKNVFLATVNFFLGCVGVTQVTRILMYQQSIKNGSTSEVLKEDAEDIESTAKGAVKDAANKVKSSV